MNTDKTTLIDLSIFHEGDQSVFTALDFTSTTGGREKLRRILTQPLSSIQQIQERQQTIQLLLKTKEQWPATITNGTIMVIYKYYESVVDTIPSGHSAFAATMYRLLHRADFSLVKYSTSHAADLLKGMKQFGELLQTGEPPLPLKTLLQEAELIYGNREVQTLLTADKIDDLQIMPLLHAAGFIRYRFKEKLFRLIELYYQLDAWMSMAAATEHWKLSWPEFIDTATPHLNAKGLYHILVDQAVSYDIALTKDKNFIFLTGANMAGKSTFIKATGIATLLAHCGMSVPAASLHLSLIDGIISNINITDDVTKGESYFYNEVQRIKNTLLKISNGNKWLVLIDELFKGTNIEDAMKCSSKVIQGLLKVRQSLFIVSTHLYEIAKEFDNDEHVSFKYFRTEMINGELKFTYDLQEGVSNDRIGYLILEREGVVKILEQF